jgi:ABC-2 type transport system ATP-binding protein
MAKQNETVLSVRNLEKTIGGNKLIHNLSFDVRAGEVFGFLGPNGAGKTTTIRMLVGLIKPTGGTVQIGGHDLQRDFVNAMREVGCIVENPELYKFLTGRENLQQFARMSDGISNERIDEVIRLVGLENRIHDKVKTYSLGMRQRLGIAQALLGKPKLLILDEPTNGLDPGGIRELREFVRTLAEHEGVGVFISSHLLSEIEMMCDRVAILHQGRCLYEGSVSELIANQQGEYVWRAEPAEKAFDLLREHPDVRGVLLDQAAIRCQTAPERVPDINKYLVDSGIKVFSLMQATPSLEDLFLEMTGGDRIA